MKINIGDKVTVYDGCLQCDVMEPVVRIEKGSYGELIYTHRKNWLGYDERCITRDRIKNIVNESRTGAILKNGATSCN